MSSLIGINKFAMVKNTHKPLINSVLCLCFVFVSFLMMAQPSSQRSLQPKDLRKLNRQQSVIWDTTYYVNGNIHSVGRQKLFYSYKGCLGIWPGYKLKGKWVYYFLSGDIKSIYWYRKGNIVRTKEFPKTI